MNNLNQKRVLLGVSGGIAAYKSAELARLFIKAGALVTKLLATGKKPNEIMIELYLRSLGRPPTAEESASLEALFNDPEQTKATLEDVQWALLNSKEFIFNH